MRENKKKTGGYVSRHAAPDGKGKKAQRSGDVPSPIESVELPRMVKKRAEAEKSAPADGVFAPGEEAGEADAPDAGKGKKSRGAKKASGRGKTGRGAPLSEEEKARRLAERKERSRRFRITVTVLACLLLLLGCAATIGGYLVTSSAVNLPKVYAGEVFVGGMDEASTLAAIEQSGWDEKASVALKVRLLGEATFKIDQHRSGAKYTAEQAAALARAYGHTGNWYLNLWEYLKCLMLPVDVTDGSVSYNRDYIRAQCEMGVRKLNRVLGDGGYEIDEERSMLCMVKGAGALQFDLDDMTAQIIAALAAGKTELHYSTVASPPEMPDFQGIHDELAIAAADAYFTDDNTFTVIDDVVGCDFDVAQAQQIWQEAENAAAVEIPIKLTYPEVTGEYLRGLLFRDRLGGMTTLFKNSSDKRISNIKLACSKINGIVLYPGDVFSYNETLGQRTEEAGFQMAGAYSNGEVVEEIGGGICQVSSTLYSAMLYSYKVNTVTRSPHYFPVDYLEKGYDATVSWPKPDFQFRNDRDFPIRIAAYCDEYERSLTIELWGTNLDGSYIELRKDTYSYNNDRYPWIMEGYGVQVHRLVFDANGMQIDQVDEIYDVYHTHEATDQIKALDAAAAAAAAAAGGLPVMG